MNSRTAPLLCALLLAACSSPEPAPGPTDSGGPAPDAAVALDGGPGPEDAASSVVDAGAGLDAASAADAEEAGPDGALPGPDAATCARPGDAGVGSAGHRLDGWAWTKTGRVAGLPEPAKALDGDLGPALVAVDGTLHLYFTRKDGLQHRIHHTTSTDAVSWSAPELIDALGTGTVVGFPSVVWTGARFRMWFGSGSIDLAESADGAHWTLVKAMTLTRGAAGGFDAYSVLYPSVRAEPAGGVTLWFTGFSGTEYAIGRATSADGREFTRAPPGPVLARGGAGALDNRSVAQPCVVSAGGRYLLWYGAYDTSLTDPGPYRVALAESADGVVWEKRGLSLELGATGDDAYSTRDPAVVRWRGRWLMVYAGMGEDSRYRLLTATSDACE